MYAHQAIRDLRDLTRKAWLPCTRDFVNSLITKISSSRKIYLGECYEFIRVHGKTRMGKFCFSDSETMGLRLPYPLCWFDFDNKSPLTNAAIKLNSSKTSKGALLCEELTDHSFIVHQLIWSDKAKQWLPLMLYSLLIDYEHFVISKGKTSIKIIWSDSFKEMYARELVSRKPTAEEIDYDTSGDLSILEVALLLLDCKNIRLVKKNKQENPMDHKRKGKKGFSYYVLGVDVANRASSGRGREKTAEIMNRLHMCRGHFKTFTKEKPLFGTITGRFWWHPHMRGSLEQGEIVKDYKVAI